MIERWMWRKGRFSQNLGMVWADDANRRKPAEIGFCYRVNVPGNASRDRIKISQRCVDLGVIVVLSETIAVLLAS